MNVKDDQFQKCTHLGNPAKTAVKYLKRVENLCRRSFIQTKIALASDQLKLFEKGFPHKIDSNSSLLSKPEEKVDSLFRNFYNPKKRGIILAKRSRMVRRHNSY